METDTIPNRNVRRRRAPNMLLPGSMPGQVPMTVDEWQEDQDHKQAQHARGFLEARRREIAERQETQRALDAAAPTPVGHGLKSYSEEIDGVRQTVSIPK